MDQTKAVTAVACSVLHAAALTVPRTGKPPIDAAAPLPRDFAALGFADG